MKSSANGQLLSRLPKRTGRGAKRDRIMADMPVLLTGVEVLTKEGD